MTESPVTLDWRLAPHESAVQKALADLARQRAVERIWAKDASLWSADPATQSQIGDSLGWLDVLEWVEPQLPGLKEFAAEIRAAGFQFVVLLGMGGSSLAGEVLGQTFPPPAGWPKLFMLDSTVPAAIRALEAQIKLEKTLFIVASKSGSTIEVAAFHAYFFDQVQKLKGEKAGEQFVAITDPGSPLAEKAAAQKFRRIFLNRADIGGRYSALSLFGLVPAALLGIELEKFLLPAKAMAAACRNPDPEKNPGLKLGAALGALALAGCDKLTLFFPPEWKSLGLWIEQLVAESTGKNGRGIVPMPCLHPGSSGFFPADRFLVFHSFGSAVSPPSTPLNNDFSDAANTLLRLDFKDSGALGAAFFLWEFATAVAGLVLRVNPFDQPDVQEAKDQTGKILQSYGTTGRLPDLPQQPGLIAMKCSGLAGQLLEKSAEGDSRTLAITAFLPPSAEVDESLQSLQAGLSDENRRATTVGYGPRYLHSTGQLHKGGSDKLRVLQLVTARQEPIPIPGMPFTFATLQAAQALGDLQALLAHGREVTRIELDGDPLEDLRWLKKYISECCDEPMPDRPTLKKTL